MKTANSILTNRGQEFMKLSRNLGEWENRRVSETDTGATRVCNIYKTIRWETKKIRTEV